jgi:hypothetical protein
MNADSEFDSQAGGGPTQLDPASLAAGFGAPSHHELLSVLETPSIGVHQGAVE